jgi:hypothetical protein
MSDHPEVRCINGHPLEQDHTGPCPQCGVTTRQIVKPLRTTIGQNLELNKTVGKTLDAKTAIVTRVTTTAITTSLARNWWLIALYLVVELSGAAVGASLSGWGSFCFSIGIDVASTIIGLYAVIRVVREVTREPA